MISPEERAMRTDLAAAYRAVAMYGWDDLVFTHISARVPGPEHHFLINPYGMMFEEITASSLVKVNLAGEKVTDSPFEINPAGFTIHSAVHEAREDAMCVIHLHTLEGVAVSCQKQGLRPISQQSLFPLSNLAYHDYEGVALNPEEKARLVRDLGDKHNMILRNHGLLTCAESVADAFLYMYILQRACEVQVRAQAGGGELVEVPRPIVEGIQKAAKVVLRQSGGNIAWPGSTGWIRAGGTKAQLDRRPRGSSPRAAARSLPQDLLHRLSLGKLVDQLVHVSDPSHQWIFDVLDADATHPPLDERGLWMDPRCFGKEGGEIASFPDLLLQTGLGIAGQPADDLVHLFLRAVLALRLLNIQRIDLGEFDAENSIGLHSPPVALAWLTSVPISHPRKTPSLSSTVLSSR
jgi:ribulose-5-phosphate 4-epimerase/fuculose-1-phosphate aldolase